MSYTCDMKGAAARHLEAAKAMRAKPPSVGGHGATAGDLFGLAAECALKAMTVEVAELRHKDVTHTHFPELRAFARERLRGRGGQALLRLLSRTVS